jgi:hypothetical protein
VLLYAYCLGVRSSRQIERRCIEDLAFRVLAGNQTPDHVTIARFRVRHQQALAGFLVHSLKLCAAVGLVRVGILALDVTKLAGNAADKANRTLDKLEYEVAEIFSEKPPRPTSRKTGCARPRPGWRPRRPNASSGMRRGSLPAPRPRPPRAGHSDG